MRNVPELFRDAQHPATPCPDELFRKELGQYRAGARNAKSHEQGLGATSQKVQALHSREKHAKLCL